MAASRNGPASEGTLADILTALGGGTASPTGATGATAPTDATLVGGADATGKLQGVATGRTVPTATLVEFLNALVWAVFHTTPTTRTDGQGGPVEADANGNLRSAEQFASSAEDNAVGVFKVEQRFSNTYIAGTTAGTLVKTGVGMVQSLTFGAPAATSVVTLYDNTAASGTVLRVFTLAAGNPFSVDLNVTFAVGLTVVVATVGAQLGISWR